ncbi:MAG: 3-dehydroquinate synthase [Bacteroidetes bacterium]|nr:3-dehydroquinate synthase [Bacteroidota bacterium]
MISILDADFTALNEYIAAQNFSKLFILCDENTHEYCLPTLLGNLETNIPFELIEIEPGEELKNIDTAIQLWEILTEFKADRKALMMNLGGGMITDLGGFVASTYKRGISFVHIPTTLLAMCDASLGGKTGVDHGFLKNLIGTFALPEAVFLYPNFLKTLPHEQVRSGFAEMLKHGLVAHAKHWQDLAHLSLDKLELIYPNIETSMQIKQKLVDEDFKETGSRKLLNFGHTVGHAVESLFLHEGTTIPHGEAVALGMIVETKLSEIKGLLNKKECMEIIEIIRSFYPYISIEAWNNATLLSLIQNDKKNSHSALLFTLISTIGKGHWDVACQEEEIFEALDFYRAMS